jgi:multiple sugar transport system ATP-binding protein
MEIYRKPATLFAARFLGSPPMNILDAARIDPGRGGSAGFRPHDVVLTAPGDGDLEGTIELVETVGSEQHVHLRLDRQGAQRIIAVVSPDEQVTPESRVGLRIRRDRLHYFEV